MKISANEIKPGTIIEYKMIWRCLKSQAVKPGKAVLLIK